MLPIWLTFTLKQCIMKQLNVNNSSAKNEKNAKVEERKYIVSKSMSMSILDSL